MYQLIALPSFTDNYIWLLEHTPTATCLVVDPGTAEPVKAWLSQHPKVQLTNILITHHHPDHIGGISELKQLTGAQVYGPSSEKIPARDIALHGGEQLTPLHGLTCQVLAVPGHTLGHIAYLISDGAQAPWLFCGDTFGRRQKISPNPAITTPSPCCASGRTNFETPVILTKAPSINKIARLSSHMSDLAHAAKAKQVPWLGSRAQRLPNR